MPSSRKGKAVQSADRSTPQSSRLAKRKSPATEETDSEPSQAKKVRPSIADLISSQGSVHTDGGSESAESTKRKREHEDLSPNGTHARLAVKPRSVADMYTFTSRTRPNGIIDLTESKSPPRPNGLNGIRPLGQPGSGGPKKLVVKNLRTTPRIDPQEFFDRKWKEEEAALDSLFSGGEVKLLLEELYKGAEHVCRQGKAAELFERLKHKCASHLTNSVRPSLARQLKSSRSVDVLQAFVASWILWQKQIQTIRHIFFYLNQSYLLRSPEHGDINSMGLQLFRSTIFYDPEIRQKVLDGALELIQLERNRGKSDGILLKQAIDTFHELNVYTTDFESLLVEATENYFRTWRTAEAEKDDLPHYVRSCSELFNREMTRCELLSLDQSTIAQIATKFDQILVDENVERLSSEDSVLDMFEDDMNKEIEQTWTLLARRKHQHLLAPHYGKYVETEGSVIVFDEKREEEMVIRLLSFKKKLDNFHVECFHKDDTMGNTLHKSFEVFMNKSKKSQTNWDTDNAKPGEMIAKHIDLLLKGGVKAIPKLAVRKDSMDGENEPDFDEDESDDASIERHLADSLDLFRFVHGKAVFEAFYKKDLARRLLMGRTQSFDAERSMLSRLRNECGANFTHNLESMFKDMDLAREEMKAYNQRLSDREIKPTIELAVSVLSVAAWPTYPDVPVNIPTSISKAQSGFEQYYKDKHVGRKLTWKPSLAHCQLRARFPKGYKELVVSGFQAIVLLLFNDVAGTDSLSYEQIKSATNLPDNELKRTMQSLACAKYRVLTKTPKGREVNETDSFTFNEKFSDAKLRVKINQIQLKETKEENKETHQRVAADRHYETQAAIVRIMKARKKIGHNELIVEVIKATRSRGVLDQADIKKNIEKLIEKDYMEREDDIKGYSYLA